MSRPPVFHLRSLQFIPAACLVLALLTGCGNWLVEDPDLITPSATLSPTPLVTGTAAVAYVATVTPMTPTVTATITLTPIVSPTPPIGPTSTLEPAALTATASNPEADRAPVIEYFVAVPTDARPGDRIQFFWATRNVTQAALWRVKEDGSPGRAFPVPPSGQYDLPALAAGREEEFVLSATNGHVTVEARVHVNVSCPLEFFFEDVPEESCPTTEAVSENATFQAFEHGQMFWMQTANQIIILFTSGEPAWMIVVNPFFDGAPEDDPNIIPPEGMRQPRREFGMVWRDTPGVRERVGWALGDPLPYLMTKQTADVEGQSQLFFTDPVGSVIRLVPDGEEWIVL